MITVDTTDPVITISSPIATNYTTSTIILTYSISEIAITTIYIDNVANTSSLASGTSLTGLGDGMHNLTIIAKDIVGNTATVEVLFGIITTTSLKTPEINSPNDISYVQGTSGNWINWAVTDDNLNNYVVYRNNSIIESNPFVSKNEISVNVDFLIEGAYNYTLIVFDKDELNSTDTVFVFVLKEISSSEVSSESKDTSVSKSKPSEIEISTTNFGLGLFSIFGFILLVLKRKKIFRN